MIKLDLTSIYEVLTVCQAMTLHLPFLILLLSKPCAGDSHNDISSPMSRH